MWEARAAGTDEASALVDWLLSVALPALADQPGYDAAEVFTGAENRVVVLAWFRAEPPDLPEPPGRLMARPAHSWEFRSAGRR